MVVTPTAVDDRSFESVVPLTPEQIAANTAHFAERGVEYSVQTSDDDGKPVPAGDKPAETDTTVADTKTADSVAPEDADIHAEASAELAELQAAKTDGERLGYQAKRTKKIRELKQEVEASKATLSTKDALLAEKDREIERLLKVGKPAEAAPVSPFAPPAAPAAAPTAEPAKVDPVEEIKPKEFAEAAPAEPEFEQFQDESDPYKAYAVAMSKYTKESVRYELRKDAYDKSQAVEVDRLKQQRSQEREQGQRKAQTVAQKYQAAKEAHSDFDAVTASAPMTPIMNYVLRERIADGLEIAYQLAKPEHTELYRELFALTDPHNPKNSDLHTADKIGEAVDTVLLELGSLRKDLKKGVVRNGQPAVAAAPVAAPPPANGTGATPPQQSSSDPSPRREEGAPIPVRGRSAPGPLRPEEIDPMDSDARRLARKAQGLM